MPHILNNLAGLITDIQLAFSALFLDITGAYDNYTHSNTSRENGTIVTSTKIKKIHDTVIFK